MLQKIWLFPWNIHPRNPIAFPLHIVSKHLCILFWESGGSKHLSTMLPHFFFHQTGTSCFAATNKYLTGLSYTCTTHFWMLLIPFFNVALTLLQSSLKMHSLPPLGLSPWLKDVINHMLSKIGFQRISSDRYRVLVIRKPYHQWVIARLKFHENRSIISTKSLCQCHQLFKFQNLSSILYVLMYTVVHMKNSFYLFSPL